MTQIRGYSPNPFNGTVDSGVVDNTSIGFYSTAAAAQHAAIANATDTATAITQLNLSLASLRALGLIAT